MFFRNHASKKPGEYTTREQKTESAVEKESTKECDETSHQEKETKDHQELTSKSLHTKNTVAFCFMKTTRMHLRSSQTKKNLKKEKVD